MPSPLTLPLRYTRRKPPVGTPLRFGSPLTHGLVLACSCNEGAGASVYDATRKGGNGVLSGSGAVWATGDGGPALSFNGGGGLVAGTSPFGGLASCTWVSRVNISSSAGPAACWWSGNTNYASSFFFGRDSGASGTASSGQIYLGSTKTSFAVAFDTWQHVAIVLNSGTVTIYVEGVQVATAGGQPSVPAHTGYQVGTNSATNLPFSGKVSHYMGYNRALSPAEVRSLYLAPFSMFGG